MITRLIMSGICVITLTLFQTIVTIPGESSSTVIASTLDEREISVDTTKNVYAKGELVDITITNIGTMPVAGFIFIDFYCITESYDLVFYLRPSDIPDLYELSPGETYTYNWSQINKNNFQVDEGNYAVKVRFLQCCGPIATDWAYFTIQSASVDRIDGGKGISIYIKNNGTETVYNISWSVDIFKTFGFILTGLHSEGEISSIEAGDCKLVITNPIIGFGKANLFISLDFIQRILQCVLFGPMVFINV